jgi:hypothetical protein
MRYVLATIVLCLSACGGPTESLEPVGTAALALDAGTPDPGVTDTGRSCSSLFAAGGCTAEHESIICGVSPTTGQLTWQIWHNFDASHCGG